MTLRSVSPDNPQWSDLQSALIVAGLPVDDLIQPGQHFFVADNGAFGGIAVDGADALLRSIVVPPTGRARGAGREIVEALAQEAARRGATDGWLLTTNAAEFFARCGFNIVRRETAPAFVRSTRQFGGLCPDSAPLMHRALIV